MKKGFTLIELLVVIAILAVLAVVVVLVLNPAQLLAGARDNNRLSDMATMNSAISLFLADVMSGNQLGSANTVYVSIPDPTATSTAGDQCQGLGLPSLPSGWNYHCAATSTYRLTNSTGWIPINFSQASFGAPLSILPVDPSNNSSSRLYYTYTTNGTQFEVTAAMESAKYRLGGSADVVGPDGATLATVYAKGTNLALEPLDYGDPSLVGLWTFAEGTGSIAYDYSGNGNNGSWNGTATGTSGYYSPGQVGSWAGAFDGSSTYALVNNTSSLNITGAMTISAWIYPRVWNTYSQFVAKGGNGGGHAEQYESFNYGGVLGFQSNGGSGPKGSTSVSTLLNKWTYVVMTFNGATVTIYINGNYDGSGAQPALPSTTENVYIGAEARTSTQSLYFNGLMDDVRIYNRALSAAQIAAMYAGAK